MLNLSLSSLKIFAAVNSAKFGMWTVPPPLVSIVLAFLTKNVVVSLFIGTITGCIMLQLNGFNIITALTQGFIDFTYRALNSLADPWNGDNSSSFSYWRSNSFSS